MSFSKTRLTATFLAVIVLNTGCVTQKSINRNLDQVELKTYRNWKKQRIKVVHSDTSAKLQQIPTKQKSRTQPVITGQLNLQEAVKLALLNNRSLQSAIEQKNFAHGRVLQSAGVYTPNIELNAGYTRPEKVTSFDINGRKIQIGFKNNYNIGISITQPIFDEGSFAAAMKGARLYDAMTDKQIQAAAENVIFQASKLYLNILLLKQKYRVAKHQAALSDSMLHNTKIQHHFGTASDFNLLRAKVQLSNDRTAMLRSKNDLEQSKARLFKTMGVSQNSAVMFHDTLRYQPMPITEQQAVKRALLNRPDLEAQLLTVKLQHQAIVRAKGAYFPKISAFFKNRWAKPSPFIQTKNTWGRIYNFGLQLSWSLFDLSREGEIIQEKSKLRQQKLTYLNEREQVLYEVHSAILGMQNASKAIQSQKLTLEQAKEGLHLAQVGYREGIQTQVAVLDARQSFAQAKLNYFRSLRDYELAHLKLLKATGQLRFHIEATPESLNEVNFNR